MSGNPEGFQQCTNADKIIGIATYRIDFLLIFIKKTVLFDSSNTLAY